MSPAEKRLMLELARSIAGIQGALSMLVANCCEAHKNPAAHKMIETTNHRRVQLLKAHDDVKDDYKAQAAKDKEFDKLATMKASQNK